MNKISYPTPGWNNKFKLQVGTRVTFLVGSIQAEGTIVKRYEGGRNGGVSYSVRVLSGIGAGKDWTCNPDEVWNCNPPATPTI